MPEAEHFLAPYDREYSLDDILKAAGTDRLQQIFSNILGDQYCIQLPAGELLLGSNGQYERKIPVYLDMEVGGYLCCTANVDDRLVTAMENILKMIIATQQQYLMFSNLHIETIHADYAEIKDRNEKLRASEQRYRQLCDELDQRVQQQITVIEKRQQQLYQSERLSSIGRMAAGVAHEINNPIGFVLSNLHTANRYVENLQGFAELMRQPATHDAMIAYWADHEIATDIEDFPQLLQENIQGAERVKSIVGSLLNHSAFDPGESVPSHLGNLLRNAVEMAAACIENTCAPQFELSEDITILCNTVNLRLAFFNIALNALQAITDHGEIRINSSTQDKRIHVEFSDNGSGMNANTLEHAFDPFFTTRVVGQGVGLGLTTAREIIQSHGGNILLASQPGQGTRVMISLPITDNEQK